MSGWKATRSSVVALLSPKTAALGPAAADVAVLNCLAYDKGSYCITPACMIIHHDAPFTLYNYTLNLTMLSIRPENYLPDHWWGSASPVIPNKTENRKIAFHFILYAEPCTAEVVVLDGVAYHQGAAGVKVLQGDERTPFMTITQLEKARCRQVGSRCTLSVRYWARQAFNCISEY